jgi:hypothetical protein
MRGGKMPTYKIFYVCWLDAKNIEEAMDIHRETLNENFFIDYLRDLENWKSELVEKGPNQGGIEPNRDIGINLDEEIAKG